MKRFITYVLLFLGCFLLSDLLLVYVAKKSFNEQSFILPADKQVLILGDSHLECALDDAILNNTVNLCCSGESYLYTYVKMKQFLPVNPHIKTVWLSFNFGSFSKEPDWWLYNKEGDTNIDRYAYFFGSEEIAVFSKNSRYYLSLMRLPYYYRCLIMNEILGTENSYRDLRWGGYLHLDKNNLQNGGMSEIEISTSSIQYIYLNKIVEYCVDNGVNLILINSPIKNKTKLNAVVFHQFTDSLKYNHENIHYWNYTGFPLSDSYYADQGHLNYKGAEVFSKFLKQHLLDD